jgi:diguanylate cyclase (GGDEF)-like protein
VRLTTSHDPLVAAREASAATVSALVIGTLLLVFALDRATDAAPVQHLYYVPIILAARRFRMPGGIVVAIASIVLYHIANPHLLTFRYEESDVVQIVLFLGVGIVTAKLAHDSRRLRHLAMTDDLTGLHNLRSFEAQLAATVRGSRERREPIALLVLDLDRLKAVNDELGHLAGAEAVRTVGLIIGHRLPPDAAACRYGGDEFAIVIPRCPPLVARRIADELRRAVHEIAPVLAGRRLDAGALSISVGASCMVLEPSPRPPRSSSADIAVGEALFQAADAALYRAKAGGRNQVCVVSS